MTTYTLGAEIFIDEIKKHRELWAQPSRSEGNRFKSTVKRAAWSKVAKVFIPDFDSMNDVEKNDVYRKLHSKWRNIRDAYVRNIKRRNSKRQYMYARNLTFLNSRYIGQTNEQTDEESSDEDKTTDKSENAEVGSDDESSRSNVKRQKIEKANIEFVDTPSVSNIDFNHTVEDEDRSFFDSLLPAVREFDLDQKLDFRCEVLKND